MLPSSSMSKFWAGIGVEVIAVGLGVSITPAWGWVIAFAGLFFFIPAVKKWWGERRQSVTSHPEFITLKDAAVKLYGECRAHKSKWATGAEELSGAGISRGNSDDILNWMATLIAGKKPVYGTRAPSIVREKISKEILKHATFIKSATRLEHFLPGEGVIYTNVEMKVADLNELIEQMSFEAVDQED